MSGLDQLAPSAYVHMIFYYKTSGEVDRCGQLVKSLSEVLNLYYPLAGRVTRDGLEVDCGNQGVKPVVRSIDAVQLVKSLSEVLNLYYPLAGRVTLDGLEVDCSNQGVKYLETRVSITLNDFLSHGPKIDLVGQLIGAADLVTNTYVGSRRGHCL
ncbi:hypothetical protein L1987_49158 [Smallanthus sonchifolius]|uniref:Uncharacterized protein n=1 Tax=Smallanthus sonchifolius TaxID=185202 RepID=A0ACB9FTQ8_9ASTR|nr:hypothetical protein L1987_49158 [Smallanthus sonchifolius]